MSEDFKRRPLVPLIGDFAVYNANALALRGLQAISRRAPLGVYGETLDLAISTLKPDVWADVLERAKCVSWLDDVVDPGDVLKYEGHKLGKSQSTLYFFDKYMRRKNNVFSTENVNEGILHILFHLTLFVSEETPKVLGVDNIDAALNPQLCRDLMKQVLRQRVVEAINAWLEGQFVDRVRHAVAVEETDAWVLTIHATKDTATHHDPKEKLRTALNKTLSDKERKRLFQLKMYKKYDELTRPFRKARDLEKCAARNVSLRLFLDSLTPPA